MEPESLAKNLYEVHFSAVTDVHLVASDSPEHDNKIVPLVGFLGWLSHHNTLTGDEGNSFAYTLSTERVTPDPVDDRSILAVHLCAKPYAMAPECLSAAEFIFGLCGGEACVKITRKNALGVRGMTLTSPKEDRRAILSGFIATPAELNHNSRRIICTSGRDKTVSPTF